MKKIWFAISIGIAVLPVRAIGAESGMPQLNPEFWSAQIFWLILIFTSLYLIIWKIFLPLSLLWLVLTSSYLYYFNLLPIN